MQSIYANQIMELYGTMLPLSILLIENDEDRQFLTEIYLQYKSMMYKVAARYFNQNFSEIEDAVSGAVENLCKKHLTLQAVECNKRASYIITTIRNVCRGRLRELQKQKGTRDYTVEAEILEAIPGGDDTQGIVFNRIFAIDLLNSFDVLPEKDKELIRMRHIDMLEYEEIGQELGITAGAAKTAVSRAKSKLEKLAAEKKRDGVDG